MNLAVVGQGAVGAALTVALRAAGMDVVALRARALPARVAADAYLLAVRDPVLADVTRAVLAAHDGPPALFLHTAGALPSRVLVDAGAIDAAVLHPLVAFAGPSPELRGAAFAVEGTGQAAELAESLARRLGGHPLRLQAEQLARWHAAAALASNHVLGLVDAARVLLVDLGLSDERAQAALGGLFGGVARNLAAVGLPAALTGPIARGDVAAVERHLTALGPPARALYAATGLHVCTVAAAQGRADAAHLDRIRALLLLYAPASLD